MVRERGGLSYKMQVIFEDLEIKLEVHRTYFQHSWVILKF
jgi:hypothetical protein